MVRGGSRQGNMVDHYLSPHRLHVGWQCDRALAREERFCGQQDKGVGVAGGG